AGLCDICAPGSSRKLRGVERLWSRLGICSPGKPRSLPGASLPSGVGCALPPLRGCGNLTPCADGDAAVPPGGGTLDGTQLFRSRWIHVYKVEFRTGTVARQQSGSSEG